MHKFHSVLDLGCSIMFDIIVNPAILRSQADELKNAADELSQVQGELSSIINSIDPSAYEGKLRQMIDDILSDAERETRKLANEINLLQEHLTKKASDFEAANMATSNSFGAIMASIITTKNTLTAFWTGAAGFTLGAARTITLIGSQEKPDDKFTTFPEPAKVIIKTDTVPLNKSANTADCVKFVEGQRPRPSGFISDKLYSGKYKGQKGELAGGFKYGQAPKAGSIMVESKNSSADITSGHASYVYEVNYDDREKVISYKVAEGRWGEGDPPPIHYETFYWNSDTDSYVSESGKRSPDMFIY